MYIQIQSPLGDIQRKFRQNLKDHCNRQWSIPASGDTIRKCLLTERFKKRFSVKEKFHLSKWLIIQETEAIRSGMALLTPPRKSCWEFSSYQWLSHSVFRWMEIFIHQKSLLVFPIMGLEFWYSLVREIGVGGESPRIPGLSISVLYQIQGKVVKGLLEVDGHEPGKLQSWSRH